jgi:hypothetical protein
MRKNTGYSYPHDGTGSSNSGDAEGGWVAQTYPTEENPATYAYDPALGPPLYIVTPGGVVLNQDSPHWSAEGSLPLSGPQTQGSPYLAPAHHFPSGGSHQHLQYTTVLATSNDGVGGSFVPQTDVLRRLSGSSQSSHPHLFDAPSSQQSFPVWGEIPQERIAANQVAHPSFQTPARGHGYSLEEQQLYSQNSRPSISTSTSPGTSSSSVGTTTRPYARNPFVEESFPTLDDDHFRKRVALYEVMNSDWKINNEMEPKEQLLLQFMTHDRQEGRWNCCFYELGKPCGKSFRPKDHAKGHIRTHLKHLPYACAQPW